MPTALTVPKSVAKKAETTPINNVLPAAVMRRSFSNKRAYSAKPISPLAPTVLLSTNEYATTVSMGKYMSTNAKTSTTQPITVKIRFLFFIPPILPA